VTDGNAAAATIWVYDLANKLKTRLTFAGGTHRSPAWSPDGKQIAFTTNQQATIAVKPATGAADEKVLVSSSASTSSFPEVDDWSRDGRYILYDQGSGNKLHLFVLPMFGDGKPFPYANGSPDEEAGVFSPDGRWVAYNSNETGRPEVYVAPFPWTGAKWQVSIDGGTWPRWRGDGKEIFFFEFGSSQLVSAQVDGSGSTFVVGGTKPLFRLNLETLSRAYEPTRDGQRFLVISRNGGTSQPLTLVQNWTAELKKK